MTGDDRTMLNDMPNGVPSWFVALPACVTVAELLEPPGDDPLQLISRFALGAVCAIISIGLGVLWIEDRRRFRRDPCQHCDGKGYSLVRRSPRPERTP